MSWFKRAKEGLKPQKKKDMPELWLKCVGCGEIVYKKELEKHFHVCTHCGYHFRMKSADYIEHLIDSGQFDEFDVKISSVDFLKFKALKRYSEQLKAATKKTGQNSAIRVGFGKINEHAVVLCVMDFSFIGGSMGSVVGEKIARATDRALDRHVPLIIISASGGARMMEGALSLMQMAKTSSRLARLAEHGLPYISILTDPTTGGVTASFAMLGDVILAEPGALVGFAGPRVIKQTIGQDLPDGFQSANFQLEHGFVDAVVDRSELKERLTEILEFCTDRQVPDTLRNGEVNATAKETFMPLGVSLTGPDDEEAARN